MQEGLLGIIHKDISCISFSDELLKGGRRQQSACCRGEKILCFTETLTYKVRDV